MSLRPAERRTYERGISRRATAITRTKSSGFGFSAPYSGVPGTCISWLIGTLSRMLWQRRERVQQLRAIELRLAEAENAAAADVDARVAHGLQRIEPILVRARRDDFAVVRLSDVSRLWL